jgi:hypothetical protein
MFLSFGKISRELEKKRKKSDNIRYDKRDSLLKRKHSSESDEWYKAMTISRSHFKKSKYNSLEFWCKS